MILFVHISHFVDARTMLAHSSPEESATMENKTLVIVSQKVQYVAYYLAFYVCHHCQIVIDLWLHIKPIS